MLYKPINRIDIVLIKNILGIYIYPNSKNLWMWEVKNKEKLG